MLVFGRMPCSLGGTSDLLHQILDVLGMLLVLLLLLRSERGLVSSVAAFSNKKVDLRSNLPSYEVEGLLTGHGGKEEYCAGVARLVVNLFRPAVVVRWRRRLVNRFSLWSSDLSLGIEAAVSASVHHSSPWPAVEARRERSWWTC
jgi:hypothetical protein